MTRKLLNTEVISETVEKVRKTTEKRTVEAPVEFIHTGATPLNCAAAGKGLMGGWARGRIVNIVGDGSSGKTLLALEVAARCFYKMKGNISEHFPEVKKVRIVYDNAERVMDFPLETMYGKEFVKGVEWIHSETVEQFGRRYTKEIQNHKSGEFLLYIVDSLDALPSQAAVERFLKAAKTDKEEDGTYGTEKAKYLSASFFNNICDLMEGKDITLIIINQIREKIGITFGEKYYRAGGKALDFYTHQVCWLSEIEKLKKTFKGHERVYGIRIKARFKRNKTAKPFREAEVIALYDYGIDDIGSGLAWLYGPAVKDLVWDEVHYARPELIKHIEENDLSEELARRIEEEWQYIEDNVTTDRKSKY